MATIVGIVLVLAAFLLGHESWPQRSTTVPPAPTTAMTVPVLGEKFTLLPCSQANTLGLEGCAEHQIVALDAQINSLRRRVYSSLTFIGARRNFVKGEVQWTSYRSSLCLSESSVYQGGSLAPVAYANCLVNSDRRHVSTLHQFVEALSHP